MYHLLQRKLCHFPHLTRFIRFRFTGNCDPVVVLLVILLLLNREHFCRQDVISLNCRYFLLLLNNLLCLRRYRSMTMRFRVNNYILCFHSICLRHFNLLLTYIPFRLYCNSRPCTKKTFIN